MKKEEGKKEGERQYNAREYRLDLYPVSVQSCGIAASKQKLARGH